MPFTQKRIKILLTKKIPSLSEHDIDEFLKISSYYETDGIKIILKSGKKSQMAFYILEGAVRGYIYNDNGLLEICGTQI